jgi:hypothetical protein
VEVYVGWVEGVETHLQVLTFDFDVLDALQTGRYWRIRQLHEARPERCRLRFSSPSLINSASVRTAARGSTPGLSRDDVNASRDYDGPILERPDPREARLL